MEIRLKGGPCDGNVISTQGSTITFTMTEIAFSKDPDAIDFERFRYVETRETDGAGRRIFKYEPREVSVVVNAVVVTQDNVSQT
jgi:hypothetical protein